ncbi:kinase-like domain-containing protein [Chaetomium sp. MPI-CAGE-AT-0009]|nr:kinase-like domain-containing protein [Chaetomium sp. MPI-CAGE-AT-0009]
MSGDITRPNASLAADTTIANAMTDHQTTSQSVPPNYRRCNPMYWFDKEQDHLFSGFEEFSSYGPGGYHPVALGDVLDGRFRVAHKLGFGRDATVWLCHDKVSNKWRAVKIMRADKSTPNCPDLRALELFKDADPDVLMASHIQLPLEHFWIDGPNGRHLCLVLLFLGPTLKSLSRLYGHVPELMKDICFQMVEALKFIHSRNLCHGDFRADNILLKLVDGVDEWEEEAVMKLLGRPIRHWDSASDSDLETDDEADLETDEDEDDEADLETDDNEDDEADLETEPKPGVPDYLVRVSCVAYRSGVCLSEIAVIGFGVSFPVFEPSVRQCCGIPFPYSAPEAIFGSYHSIGFQSDLWALGVTIAKVRRGKLPFATVVDSFFPFEIDDVCRFEGVGRMECTMGPMPHPYRAVWRKEWETMFSVWKDDKDMFAKPEPLSDESWNDETVFTTTMDPEEEEDIHQRGIREGRSFSWLQNYWHGELLMDIDHEQAAEIAARAAANPGRLPTYKPILDKNGDETAVVYFKQLVQHRLPGAEMEQMIDLFLQVFRWHPEQRATLDQIANHAWFGDRKLRRRPAV